MKQWVLNWRGVSFTGDDLLGVDGELVEMITGRPYSFDPIKGGTVVAGALIAAYLIRTQERTLEDIASELSSAPLAERLAALEVVDVEPPKAEQPPVVLPPEDPTPARSPKKPRKPAPAAVAV